jgi:ABC-type uncharacterized transport system ATPase subunit
LDSLRKKKQKKFRLCLKNKSENAPDLSSAEFLSKQKDQYEYILTGTFTQLNKELAQYEIEDLIIPEPTLEDIFMSYYEKSKNKKNDQG